MSGDYADLAARLRAPNPRGGIEAGWHSLLDEAADAILALLADLDAARAETDRAHRGSEAKAENWEEWSNSVAERLDPSRYDRMKAAVDEVRRICKDPVGPVSWRDGMPEPVVFARDLLRIVGED